MITSRVFAALAAALVLSACGTQAMPGAATRSAAQLEAMRRTAPAPAAAAKAIDFSTLVVNDVAALRDGGTVIAKGYVTRSTYVTIKFDGGLSSKTRGQVFVGAHDFMKPEGDLRPALAEELAALPKALRSNAGRAGANLDAGALNRLADTIEKAAEAPAAGGKVTGLAIEKLPVRCPCFELKATYDGKPLVVRFEGMPGGYTIESVELAGRQLTGADRAPVAAALKAAAPDAGTRAMMVEDVAEAMAAK